MISVALSVLVFILKWTKQRAELTNCTQTYIEFERMGLCNLLEFEEEQQTSFALRLDSVGLPLLVVAHVRGTLLTEI